MSGDIVVRKITHNKRNQEFYVSESGEILVKVKSWIDNKGYKCVTVNKHNYLVHRIVAKAFCDNPNNYEIVGHIDDDKLNNSKENLKWMTSKENNISAREHKLNKRQLNIFCHETGETYYSCGDAARKIFKSDKHGILNGIRRCAKKERGSFHGYHFEISK